MLFKFHPERKDLLRGQLVQTLCRRIAVGRIILLKIVLLWIQSQKFLLNFRNAVLGIEHFIQLFGKRGCLLIQLLPFLWWYLPIAHIRIGTGLSLQELLLVGKASEKRSQKNSILLFQLFRHIVCCRVVVGYDRHGLPAPDNIGDDIQNRLRLSCPRRALNDADFGGKRPLHRQLLALVQAKRIDYRLRHLRCPDFFPWCKIACQHSILADLLDLVILHTQNVDTFHLEANCRGSFLEILECFLIFTVCQAILLELHFVSTEG